MLYRDYLSTPIGDLETVANETGLCSVYFVEARTAVDPNQITQDAVQQLREYFDGARQAFDLPLSASGTDFQRSVWAQLSKVEFAKTCSYQDIANAIDNPKAVRAVGAANGKNPLTVIVPCHRVIGADGTLTGYAGGLKRKEWLLRHEGVLKA